MTRVARGVPLAITAGLLVAVGPATSHPGPAHTATVKLSGAGSGTVKDGPGRIECPPDCSGTYGGPNDPNHPAAVTLTATPAPGSTRFVRLVARDRFGRTAQARIGVTMPSVAPAFLDLRAPARLSPRARRLTVSTAATMPATLSVAGRRITVDRRVRAIAVAVRPGRAALSLRLRLSARGRAVTTVVRIKRG